MQRVRVESPTGKCRMGCCDPSSLCISPLKVSIRKQIKLSSLIIIIVIFIEDTSQSNLQKGPRIKRTKLN